jgi:hypothetical protein
MISAKNLWNCAGTPDCPVLIDARTDGDFAADPHLIPSVIRRFPAISESWLILR